jgi:hypothetical protein
MNFLIKDFGDDRIRERALRPLIDRAVAGALYLIHLRKIQIVKLNGIVYLYAWLDRHPDVCPMVVG